MTRLSRSLSLLRRLRLARRDATAAWSDRLDAVALANADRELCRHDDAIGYDAVTSSGRVLQTGERAAGNVSGLHRDAGGVMQPGQKCSGFPRGRLRQERCLHAAAIALGEKGCCECGERLVDSPLGKAAP